MNKRQWQRCKFSVQKGEHIIFGMWYCIKKRLLCIGGPKKFAEEMNEFASYYNATYFTTVVHPDKQRCKIFYTCTGFAFLSGKKEAGETFFIHPIERFRRIMN